MQQNTTYLGLLRERNMIDYIKNAIESIYKEINIQDDGSIYILHSDQGTGKSTIAKSFPLVYKNTLSLRCGDEIGLSALISKNGTKKDYDRHLCLYKPLIKKIKKEQIHTILFDVESNAEEDFFNLVEDIFDTINRQFYKLDVVIFLDNRLYYHLHNVFAKYHKINYVKPLKKWNKHDFYQLWCEWYGENKIDAADFEVIVSYSMGNANVFLQHLNTLKYYNVLIFKNGSWMVEPSTHYEEILKEKYSEIVQKKYETLDPKLQTIIKQTSSIGYIFQRSTLKDVFNVQNAKTVLKKIELLTELLFYTDLEMENGRFYSESVQIQIEEMIEPSDLNVWCEALAEYYEEKLTKTAPISLERANLKEKCIIYYSKINNITKMILHYFSLIQLKYLLCQYNSAIKISEKLATITKEYLEYKEIYGYCFYMLAIINRSLANYTEALRNLNKYTEIIERDTDEIKTLKAELLYGVGNTSSAYDILKSLYNDCRFIDDPILKIRIVSMLSSIEETINNNQYVKHFNEAIELARNNNLPKEYYRLLRKANMTHSGENGITLMRTAEKYFATHKMICELAMVRHNIGTESLFHESTYKYAYNRLNLAYQTATNIGLSQLEYILNSLAIYHILEHEYESAIIIFDHLLGFQQDDFSLLALLLNKTTCLRKQGALPKANLCLSEAQKLNSKAGNQFPYFSAQIIMQRVYFNIATTKYYDAYLALLEYFQLDFEDRTENVISAKIILRELCIIKGLQFPQIISEFSEDYDDITKRIAEEHLVLCELMFWE